MADKNFLRLDKVKQFGHYESVVSEDQELLAGQFVKLGKVIDVSQGEEVEIELATAGGDFDAIVAPVYLDNGYADFDILTQSIPAGKPARAYIAEKGDMVSINAELAPDVVVGDEVEVGTNGLGFQKAASGTAIGQVIAKEHLNGVGDLVVVRFK